MQSKSIGDFKIKQIKFLKNKVRIIFTNLEKLEISNDTYTDFHLFVGRMLTNKEIKEIKTKDNDKQYLNYVLNILSKASYSSNEIKMKLEKKKAPKRVIKDILNYLEKYQLISDDIYIKERIEYGNYMHYGKNKILEDLYQRKLNKEDIEKINFPIKEELNKAMYYLPILDKKFNDTSFRNKKAKIYEFLIRHGFDIEIINKVISKVNPPSDKELLEAIKKDYQKAKINYSRKYKDKELKDKIITYLIGKGYKYETINKIIGD